MNNDSMMGLAGGVIAMAFVCMGLWLVVGRSMGLMSGIVLVVVLCAVFTHDPLAQLVVRLIMNVGVPLVIILGLFRMAAGWGSARGRR